MKYDQKSLGFEKVSRKRSHDTFARGLKMKDNMKPCQHTLADDVEYKEVVIIGNGPSGMVTSFMLAGNVPYLKQIPEDLPIDDMLRARLSSVPAGQSLYEADLMELAEGLEGRSHNPIPLLMDNLLRPCADMGIQTDPLIEWRYESDKEIDHIVLGHGPPGGSWHSFPSSVLTLSPAGWLCLPPHRSPAARRLPASAVARYCRRYVSDCGLQRYFRCGVIVRSVTRCPPTTEPPCGPACPLNAAFCVTGYDKTSKRAFRYVCRRAVAACGAGDRPNSLDARLARHALHSLADIERGLHDLEQVASPPPVLVVGSGVSGADAVRAAVRARLPVRHVHRKPAEALATLQGNRYPDYCQVYKMMMDGPNAGHKDYIPYPEHVIVDIQPVATETEMDIDEALRPKCVTLLNLKNNETKEIIVSLIAVCIGSKPDLFFLQTNFDINSIDVKQCSKCGEIDLKRKADDENEDEDKQCSLKNHWYYIKSFLGQGIQSCKSRYLNYTEINGNNDTKCALKDCNKRENEKTGKKCGCLITKIENGEIKTEIQDCVIPTNEDEKEKCFCQENPYSSGIGFGIDPTKPVDGRANPVAIDVATHELLNSPKGLYALGPLTADNFVRFIPGGALAIVASIHKEAKN